MKKQRYFSLKLKVTGIVTLLVILVMSGLGVISINISNDSVSTLLDMNYYSESRFYVSEFDKYLNTYATKVDDMAGLLKGIDTTDSHVLQVFENTIEGIQVDDSNIISMYTGFDDRTYVDSTHWIPEESWICTERPWYTAAKANPGKTVVSLPYVDSETKDICITLSKTISARNNEGVAAVDIYIDALFEGLNSLMETYGNAGDYLIIASSDGDIISHKNKDYMPKDDDTFINMHTCGVDYSTPIADDSEFVDFDGTKCYITEGISELTGWSIFYVSPSVYYDKQEKNIQNKILASFFACLVVAVIASIIISFFIVKPVQKLSERLKTITDKIKDSDGDLTMRVEVPTNDEIGEVGADINSFIETLQVMIKKIKDVSENIMSASDTINSNITISNEDARNISEITEKLSASMMVVVDSATTISSTSEEVLASAEKLIAESEHGNDFVFTMKDRANEVNKLANKKSDQAKDLLEEKKEVLNNAIEETLAVRKINDLADDILSIASQTNLLALNASIEAARAGEVGKGFSVVAEEIRVLADNSRTTADSITEISTKVIQSVDNLANASKELLNAMENMIIEDYTKFADMGTSYYDDAEHVKDILNRFLTSANEVRNAMQSVTQGVTDITGNIGECGDEINDVAVSTERLVEVISTIKRESNDNTSNMNTLIEETENFKKL